MALFIYRLLPPRAALRGDDEPDSAARLRRPGWQPSRDAPRRRDSAWTPPDREPYYLPSGDEVAIFEQCHARSLAVMLKGPTGCGKTRFVEHMAWRLGRPLVTISCHDDLTASDLIGRFLIRHDGTAWQDGPLTRAVREGAICYLDEVVEARQDTVVVLHPLTDHRRILPIDKTGETDRGRAGLSAGGLVQPRLPAHAQGPEAQHAAALRRAGLRLSAGASARPRSSSAKAAPTMRRRMALVSLGAAPARPAATAAWPRCRARGC